MKKIGRLLNTPKYCLNWSAITAISRTPSTSLITIHVAKSSADIDLPFVIPTFEGKTCYAFSRLLDWYEQWQRLSQLSDRTTILSAELGNLFGLEIVSLPCTPCDKDREPFGLGKPHDF